jgi:23S rRNA G2445 N2-methylase RlmL
VVKNKPKICPIYCSLLRIRRKVSFPVLSVTLDNAQGQADTLTDMQADNDLYRRMRTLSAEHLWTIEVPKFNQASATDRTRLVGLIRAVGVVFASSGTASQKVAVKAWMKSLLQDPSEKMRRYAMAAIPKLGGDVEAEKEILSILKTSSVDREKRKAGAALEKIAGQETLQTLAQSQTPLPFSEQKIRANVARQTNPSSLRMDEILERYDTLRISLRCRKGLEALLAEEVKESAKHGGKFRLLEIRGCHVVVAATAPFTLRDLYQLRCFDTCAFSLGRIDHPQAADAIQRLAKLIASPLTERLMSSFTVGSFRYRLSFSDASTSDVLLQKCAQAAFEINPRILNDARESAWSIEVYVTPTAALVELSPKVLPDPRLAYRMGTISAASHPPLAACIARLANPQANEVVWDPFCGSGMELIETCLRGGVVKVIGSDLSEEAIQHAQNNFQAANLAGVKSHFIIGDFRNYLAETDLQPATVSLVVSNPPLGRRVRVPNLQGMFTDFFQAASRVLKPGGKLVFVNPLKLEPADSSLRRTYRQVVDLGGYDCRLEVYVKL